MERFICYLGHDHNRHCEIQCAHCEHYGRDRRRLERRKRALTFRFWERREGFDRRKHHALRKGLYHRVFRHGAFHLRNNFTMLIILLICFNLFNLADYAFTLKALALGFAEGNPVMDKLFGMGPAAAGIFKVAVGVVITTIVWLFRKYRIVLEASILILLAYMTLIGYHIYGAIRYY